MQLTSLKSKIILMAVSISILALVVSALLHSIRYVQRSKALFIDNITTSVDIISYSLEPALYFNDKDGAIEILSALTSQNEVLSAALYKKDDLSNGSNLQLFVSSSNIDASPTLFNTESSITSLGQNKIRYQRAIISDDELIGAIIIEAQITQLEKIIQDTLITSFGVLLLTTAFALMLALFISKKITHPIQTLASIAEQITAHKNFSIRVPNMQSQEMKQLGTAINEMLILIEQEIQQRELNEAHIQELNQSLESKVLERTSELANKNNELAITLQNLNESRDRLVEQEKMASLGQLVAGIAHEINTPVGIGITATSHTIDITKSLESAINDNKMTKTQFKKSLKQLHESARIALNNLDRAAHLVRSFKLVAIDQTSDDLRTFNLYDYIQEVLTSLKPTLSSTRHTISITGEQQLTIHNQPGVIAQLITNMVTNSLSHAFDGIEEGKMWISLTSNGNIVELQYKDNGNGVKESDLSQLFVPFFTTKRGSGGSGLGTHIMFNIVNHALKGQIRAESKPGQGLSYTIRFPATEQRSKPRIH